MTHRHHHQDGGGIGETYDKPPTVLAAPAAVETAGVSPIESCGGEGGYERGAGNFPSNRKDNHHAHGHVHGQRKGRSHNGHANGSGHSQKFHSGDGHSHSHAQGCGHAVVDHDMVCGNGSTVDLV